MQRRIIISALCLGQLALAAPVPAIFIKGLRLETLAAPSSSRSWTIGPATPGADGDSADQRTAATFAINNQPQQVSFELDSAAILTTAKPIETAYLLSLSSPEAESPDAASSESQPGGHREQSRLILWLRGGVEKFAKDTTVFANPDTVVQVRIGLSDAGQDDGKHDHEHEHGHHGGRGRGHWHRRGHRRHGGRHRRHRGHCAARLMREYHDMLVITLVVVFLLVVVAWEMWETLCASVRTVWTRHGPIYLDTDYEAAPQGPISVSADSEKAAERLEV